MQAIHVRIWRIVLAGVLALLLLGPAKAALAHAGERTLQQANVSAGPYRLTLWTAPAQLHTGEFHVESIVFDHNGNLEENCLVHVVLTPLDRPDPALTVLSTPMDGFMDGLQEATFHIAHPGRYQVEATVLDEQGVGGRVAFEVEIIHVSRLVQLLISLVLGASILAGVWMLAKGVDIWFDRLGPSISEHIKLPAV
jgi:hypothetical protein